MKRQGVCSNQCVDCGKDIRSETGILTFQNRNAFPLDVCLMSGGSKAFSQTIEADGVYVFTGLRKTESTACWLLRTAARGRKSR